MAGSVTSKLCRPLNSTAQRAAQPVDWNRVFALAGIDAARFAPREPHVDSAYDIRHARRMDRHARAFAVGADASRSGGLARPAGVLPPYR